MWQTIFNKLEGNSLNPFPPGKHEGECRDMYCVVKESSQVPIFNKKKVGYRLIDIIIFVPITGSYLDVKPYLEEVKAALRELSFLRSTGNETPIVTDNDVKAYTTSVEYQILKKLEG